MVRKFEACCVSTPDFWLPTDLKRLRVSKLRPDERVPGHHVQMFIALPRTFVLSIDFSAHGILLSGDFFELLATRTLGRTFI